MDVDELKAVKFTQTSPLDSDAVEFCSYDLSVALVRFKSTRMELLLNRAYTIIRTRELDLEWIKNTGSESWNNIINAHECVICKRGARTILIGAIGTVCKNCFSVLWNLLSGGFGEIDNIGNVLGTYRGSVITFAAAVTTANIYPDGKIRMYVIRKLFGCNYCLRDLNTAQLNTLPTQMICLVCGYDLSTLGAYYEVSCGENTYGYCYLCRDNAIKCYYTIIKKYIYLREIIPVWDVCGVITAIMINIKSLSFC